jgi:hypothetical protein
VEVHLLGVSHVDILVLEDATEEVTLGAEVGDLAELGIAHLLEFRDFSASRHIGSNLLHVKRVAFLVASSENNHLNRIDRYGSRRWHLTEGRILHKERGPLLHAQRLHIVQIILVVFVGILKVQIEQSTGGLRRCSYSERIARHQIYGLIVHHYSRSGAPGLFKVLHLEPLQLNSVEALRRGNRHVVLAHTSHHNNKSFLQ